MSDLPLEVTCGETKRRLDAGEELVLLDCREESEFAIGVIDGATLLPMSGIQARVGELDPHRDTPVVVYCHHGMRSAQVANWLRSQGFTAAQSMAGGIDQWAVEIDPGVPRY
ncbi:putative adenylyltransferase/sulfurtransferase MoeZ [Posidoniimonas polymericola]|uniref:Putative adenylyltransferase/sulfurtransferase MoeZ n=1 Tax=Posidoniimonas polymericola TaxID=2528002 RepID=A0A5C5YPN9_9BACT|nr:rhodanese-like domain-containing protein [Posidoniimonas polymericola]TWT76865.1 putative adenylyltransferase/sulfurtransferase MoeZ [Posidoniimonas polymericola]